MIYSDARKIIIEYISTKPNLDPDVSEALEVLKSSFNREKWDNNSVENAIKNFVLKNNRMPETRDLNENPELPSPNVIKRIYKQKTMDWVKGFCKNMGITKRSTQFSDLDNSQIISIFLSEFARISPITQADYDKLRSPNTPSVYQICRRIGIHGWVNLKKNFSLETENTRKTLSRKTSRYIASFTKDGLRSENNEQN